LKLISKEHLEEVVKKKFDIANKKRSSAANTKEQIMGRQFNAVRSTELGLKSAFQGSMRALAERLRKETGRIEEDLTPSHAATILDPGKTGLAVTIYKNVVISELPGLWKKNSDPSDPAGNPDYPDDPYSPITSDDENNPDIRTCSATLHQILRPDLVQRERRIVALLDSSRDWLADYADEISVTCLKTTVVVSGMLITLLW
jgi:hypothetical protein